MSTIISSLPYNLTNGTTADATQVMADFNSIVSQVNTNGAATNQANTFTSPQVVPNAVTLTQAVNAGQVQGGGLSWLGTIGGTANALTASPGVLPQAYSAGQVWEGTATYENVAVPQTVTISINNPAVISLAGTQVAGTPVKFQSTGALPTGLVAATTYYIVNPVSGGFEVSAAPGGVPIATSGTQSGTQTVTMPTYAPTTLAIGGMTARNITKYGGYVLAVGDLQAGMAFELLDDGVELQLINPATIPTTVATIQQVQNGTLNYGTDIGTANAYAVNLTPAPLFAPGMRVIMSAANANTGASTLNVNGAGATAINGSAGALQGGEIAAGGMYEFVLNGNSTVWELVAQQGGKLQVNSAAHSQHAISLSQSLAGASSVITSNVFGTVYTNSTPRMKRVCVTPNASASATLGVTLYVNGAVWAQFVTATAGITSELTADVQPGYTYEAVVTSGSTTVDVWAETI